MKILGGVDIGGTKCAVSLGELHEKSIKILDKIQFPTPKKSPKATIATIISSLDSLIASHNISEIASIGISCGGPLHSASGRILSPPNLPRWNNINIVSILENHFNVACTLQNDANASALAEWYWGAGQGCKNMIFLTFGTGLGAGLILNEQLYLGSTDMAGEVGHIRLSPSGPLGHGKSGSFEGFCSGGGIPYVARQMIKQWELEGKTTVLSAIPNSHISVRDIGIAVESGDLLAQEIFTEVGYHLGRGLSILIDILNPEIIVIGSIFARSERFIRKSMEEVLLKEVLPESLTCCSVVPAKLGEQLGDYAALAVTMNQIVT